MFKKHFVAQNVELFYSVFKITDPYITTPTFQEVCGVTQPHNFVESIGESHGIAFNYKKVIVFYSQGILTLIYA